MNQCHCFVEEKKDFSSLTYPCGEAWVTCQTACDKLRTGLKELQCVVANFIGRHSRCPKELDISGTIKRKHSVDVLSSVLWTGKFQSAFRCDVTDLILPQTL